ncbi:MAG: ABC transporter permease [Candidatus Humimicrobiaceae bacterium]
MERVERKKVFDFINNQKIFLILIFLVVMLSLSNRLFFTYENIMNILFQVALNGIIAIGMTYTIIGGDFDLSVGSNMALAAATIVLLERFGPFMAIIGALAVSSLAGFINGIFVTKLKINAFVTTLAMMIFLKGWVLLLTGSETIQGKSEVYLKFGYGTLFKVPYSVILFIVLYVIFGLVLSKTLWGRNIYAIGNNSKAAHFFGISIIKTKTFAFTLLGFLCGVSGLIIVSRLNTASATYGNDTALDVITAVLLGGTSLSGGEGNVFKTFQGILLLGVLGNAMIVLNITPYLQQVIKGLILIMVVSIDSYYAKVNKYK